jgi:hypothetical protein
MGGGAPPGAVPRGLLKLGGGGGALDVCGAFATTPESDGIAESFFLLRESKMSRPEPFLSLIGGGSD